MGSVCNRYRFSESGDRSILNPIVQDIKALSRNFESIQFRFTYRESNGVAHLMAKGVPWFWIEEAPFAMMSLAEVKRRLLGCCPD
ncbi:hypothetical protein V6N12_063231 [Hibiscus sabdariffa]|uniref:RNase H type-1 domain-containing protein n=1 Tax=Hibiscus sabdariffa TaxID=183260 RepID=A0ABR2FB82_9ROSI